MSEKEKVPKTVLGIKLKLNVKDRLLVSALFPEKGNLADQLTAQDIGEKVGLKTKEREEINFRAAPDGNGVLWNAEGDKAKNFNFSKTEMKFLKAQVQRLDEAKDIGMDMVTLCAMIDKAEVEED